MAYTNVPNRIVLDCRGPYMEDPAGAKLWPGQLLLKNSSGALIPHNVAGARAEPNVCQEEGLAGGTILQSITSGDVAPYRRALPGDKLLMLIQNGQNITRQAQLASAGDGTLIANPGDVLANIAAASSNITNTNTETTFSNGSLSIPANLLKAGDTLRIRFKAFCSGQNGTDTHRVRCYLNAAALADSTALALDPNDWVMGEILVTIRTIGASGTFIADGYLTTVVATTVTTTSFTVASTAIDTTAAATITVKSLASATSTGNIIRLDEFRVELNRSGGMHTLFIADETKDNSSGSARTEYVGDAIASAQFIRVIAM